jgi:DNA segregation ATPase FtsK/SpoIIIE-like protein
METESLDLDPMPYIVVVIDEMADLMLTAGKEIEAAVQRLAQMARAGAWPGNQTPRAGRQRYDAL